MGLFLGLLSIVGLTILAQDGEEGGVHLAESGQAIRTATRAVLSPASNPAASAVRWIEVEVQTEQLDVFDRPDDRGYIMGRAQRGDRLRVRADHPAGTGWLAIVPLPTEVFWIEQSSLENDEVPLANVVEHERVKMAWIDQADAVIRSGHPRARLPGPPVGVLPKGTMVQLVDRPPLDLGQGPKKSRWLAIVPPADQVSYVHATDVHWLAPTPPVPPPAEARASYEQPMPPRTAAKPKAGTPGGSSSWPPGASAELQRLDAITQAILASQPIEQWRFETVRAGYQDLLKRADDHLDLEETLRTRLNRLTRYEQAARSARTIESILAKSHRRDAEVAALRKDLAQLERTRARSFDAIGFIQPSARKVDGHKVFALIGGKGSTIAYLDMPPGLDPQRFLAHRIGVRGQTHFNEDLGTRLITVRDMENVEARN